MIKNKVVRISLMGGILGLFFTNPRKALDKCIEKNNNEGWRATFIVQHSDRNLAAMLLQVIFLVVTIGLWTFGAGYLILFEKDDNN